MSLFYLCCASSFHKLNHLYLHAFCNHHDCFSAANKYYSSVGHHELKNQKTTGQIKFLAVTIKQLMKLVFCRVYMHGSRVLYFKILHARQSKISTKYCHAQNLKMLNNFFSPENNVVHHTSNCYVHASLIIIKKYYRALYLKMPRAR